METSKYLEGLQMLPPLVRRARPQDFPFKGWMIVYNRCKNDYSCMVMDDFKTHGEAMKFLREYYSRLSGPQGFRIDLRK